MVVLTDAKYALAVNIGTPPELEKATSVSRRSEIRSILDHKNLILLLALG